MKPLPQKIPPIAVQDKLIETLKTKKRSPWARIADILLGAGIIAILK
jgi:hypothetical protein